ncbi:hypothetical protein HZH66_003660 [Vespula vulgaris]|uniref:Enoyl reductase (ER) domain-containing protein n=1 Tax=Vespula vulgaris TaxID=7454 RepID=A0A836UYX5_VESVU|nr:hypothetical protein HZH66_003660 [Vespula vulgaris]
MQRQYSVYIAHCIYCIAALYINAGMQKGDRIFIHADSCRIGQAVINLALREGYEIFTTERRRFFKETFPSIDDNHIGNSRDTSFEKIILQRTNGAGVDIVLNSLADDKLQVFLYYLAHKGRFLKIGKFDFVANNQLSTKIFMKDISFYGLNAAERDVSELIMKTAIDQGSIDGIFNFAVFLKDSICRNQTSETFEESFKEETRAAKCLGEETRKFCQNFCS